MLLDWPEGINSTSKQTVYSLSGCTAGQGYGNGVRGENFTGSAGLTCPAFTVEAPVVNSLGEVFDLYILRSGKICYGA